MIDMHCHILPAIDDGAENMEISLEMLKISKANNTSSIVATPHVMEGFLLDWETIIGECQKLHQAAHQINLHLPIFPGAEMASDFDILKCLEGPGPYCINGGRYLLIELPLMQIPYFMEEIIFMLQTKGITPIFAHPERNYDVIHDPMILKDWIHKGVLMQINSSSLLGNVGKKVKTAAEWLLTSNMAHCIGSDAHGIRERKPDLAIVQARITALVGKEKTRQIMVANPELIIQSQDVGMFSIDKPRSKNYHLAAN